MVMNEDIICNKEKDISGSGPPLGGSRGPPPRGPAGRRPFSDLRLPRLVSLPAKILDSYFSISASLNDVMNGTLISSLRINL